MEEQILVSSEQYNLKKAFCIVIIAALVLSVGLFMRWASKEYIDLVDYYKQKTYYSEEQYEIYLAHQKKGRCGEYSNSLSRCDNCIDVKNAFGLMAEYPSKESYAISVMLDKRHPIVINGYGILRSFEFVLFLYMLPAIITTIISGLIYLWLRSYQLTVTDKRIYGTVIGGRRVDLPVDSISATAAIPLLKGVSVATSSGRISFLAIKNATEIYKVISSLLIERQPEKNSATIVAPVPQSDEADQLRKYKDLLDSGVITQEEFDAKKKQLLGL